MEEFLSDHGGIDGTGELREEDRELIASDSRHGVARPQACLEPLGDLLDELVSYRMAEGVVDDLEVIEVEEEHGEGSGLTTGLRELGREVLGEEEAVGRA